MSLLALCNRRTTLLLIAAAADGAGQNWRLPQTNPTLFLEHIRTGQPHFVLITETYMKEPGLFTAIRQANPQTISILCVTPEAKMDKAFWDTIEELDFDMLSGLDELPACLQALNSGRYFLSQLLGQRHVVKPSVPGLDELTAAERRVLHGILAQKTGPQIADWLNLSEKTINNQKARIAQKLNATGGPGSLTRFVLIHREPLIEYLSGLSD